jgi:hypothetical protein
LQCGYLFLAACIIFYTAIKCYIALLLLWVLFCHFHWPESSNGSPVDFSHAPKPVL